MNDQLLQLVRGFSQELVNEIPEFQELIQAKQALDSDLVSQRLWQEKEEQRQTVDLLKKQGLPVSTEQEQRLFQKLQEMRENPITMRYLKATNFANKISGKIGAELFDLIGADFAPRRGCK